jgi:DDE superfamily endonuclease
VATACANPPKGRARWTLELLADAMVKLTEHESLSGETVRRRLAENGLKPWRRDMWCIPQIDGEYVARMEDVLDLYGEAPDPKRPVVCFDESAVQLIGEVRQPIPAEPGQLERYDCEYRRNGTVNLFVCVDVHRPWRKVKVTERRAAEDYAQCMRELVDIHYPEAACIRVVQDNLSTHTAGALYEAFAPAEARRILRRLEFHYTPKHASWLNMVEIEIGVLRGQCLDRRIDDPNRLINEIAAWRQLKWLWKRRRAVDVDIGEDHRLGRGIIPVVARRLLIVPDVFSGVGVQRHQRTQMEVIATGRGHRVVFKRLARIAGHREPAPGLVAGLGVVGGDVTARAVFRAALADHHFAVERAGRAGDGVGMVVVDESVFLPRLLPGRCVERDLAVRHRRRRTPCPCRRRRHD